MHVLSVISPEFWTALAAGIPPTLAIIAKWFDDRRLNSKTNAKLDDNTVVTKESQKLLNGGKTALLKELVESRRDNVASNPTPENEAKALAAEKLLEVHEETQK